MGAADLNCFLHIYRSVDLKYVRHARRIHTTLCHQSQRKTHFFLSSSYVTDTPSCWQMYWHKNMFGLCQVFLFSGRKTLCTVTQSHRLRSPASRGGQNTLISDGLHNVEFKQLGCAFGWSTGVDTITRTHALLLVILALWSLWSVESTAVFTVHRCLFYCVNCTFFVNINQ